MKKIIQIFAFVFLCITFIFLSRNTSAQTTTMVLKSSGKSGFGFRVGLNYAKASGSSDSVQYRYKPGLMIAVFLTPPSTGVIGYRSELLYSKQGFDYTNPNGVTGTVSNDYLMIPQMMTINITKFVQLQAGAFAGYLLHTKDSNQPKESNDNDPSKMMLDLMNRFDYGAAGGIEIHPFKGLILNARYNIGFAKLYKEPSDVPQNTTPGASFNPLAKYENMDAKNAVIQVSAGYSF